MDCSTNYPFADTLSYDIDSETDFDFYVRVPEWTVKDEATAKIGDDDAESLSPDGDGLHRVQIKKGTTKLIVQLPMEVKTVTRDGSVAFYRGPLLYSADIKYNETKYSPLDYGTQEPIPKDQLHPDAYDATYEPVSEWRYAVDPSTVTINKGDETGKLPNPIFVNNGPPTSLKVDAYPIDWPVQNGTAASPPINPTVDASKKTTIKLVPFGAAKVHIAQFPVAQINK